MLKGDTYLWWTLEEETDWVVSHVDVVTGSTATLDYKALSGAGARPVDREYTGLRLFLAEGEGTATTGGAGYAHPVLKLYTASPGF